MARNQFKLGKYRESTLYTRGLNGAGGLWAWPDGAQKLTG